MMFFLDNVKEEKEREYSRKNSAFSRVETNKQTSKETETKEIYVQGRREV